MTRTPIQLKQVQKSAKIVCFILSKVNYKICILTQGAIVDKAIF